jgi:hypothetical protein
MNWILQNAVAVSFLIVEAAIIIAVVVLVLSIRTAIRRIKASSAALSDAGKALAADAQRVADALAALPDRQAEVQLAIADLSTHAAVVGVLARHTLMTHRAIRRPLWFLGL